MAWNRTYTATPTEVQDVKVPGSPGTNATCGDGISSVSFAPNNLLLASSWDTYVRVWQVQKQGQQVAATPAAQAKLDGPALCGCFNHDGSVAFAGGADNTVRMWQLGGSAGATVIGRHDQPVRSVHFIQQNNMLVTGSWDATVRFWDMRSPTEVHKLQLNQKVYAMDVSYPLMVVSTAEVSGQAVQQPGVQPVQTAAQAAGHPLVHLYSLAQGAPQLFNNQPIQSTLKHQTRCVALFNNQRQGFAVGSVEGRVEIKDINELTGRRSFAFKCHRQKSPGVGVGGKEHQRVYPVNAIAFNSRGTFATAGSDGVFNFWDKENKTRLKEYRPGTGCRQGQPAGAPAAAAGLGQPQQPAVAGPQTISCCAFNHGADLFAYATSYDYSRGDDPAMRALPNDIYLHPVTEAELKVPAAKQGGRR